ncbi:hypothetical protein [Fibrella forsythiae]|uniref:Glycosyltransferase RgtA/B/C/D-like domain-containing protein n=1 Tax=Fibrella forsythiae TaxID=2817061 RepID=A0ABS3JSR2_9BACT|nr:hypothetical protein [Fibrella forsythiae]MBO0953049.1 hypothetical protein [Fibrella forsythiae]
MEYQYNDLRLTNHSAVRNRLILLSLVMLVGITATLVASLYFKAPWLWMDEVLSNILLTDPSLGHMNHAIVSNIDANPPLFFNLYWLLGHTISLNPYFLRAVSILLFALSLTLLYRYTTRLIARPVTNFVLLTLLSSLTYLNYTLSTQMRAYSLYLLLSCVYFLVNHQLIRRPAHWSLLGLHLVVGLALVMTHNFGAFYVGASFSFFGLLLLWSKRRAYSLVLGSHLLTGGGWLVLWFANFQIQSQAARPHTWIPLPTFLSFFHTLGELLPNLSAHLEKLPGLDFLAVLRIGLVVGLFVTIALPRIKEGFAAMVTDEAFSFYLLTGYLALAVAGATLIISFGYLSVFLSRYQWPTTLLVSFQLIYAYHYYAGPVSGSPTRSLPGWLGLSRWLPLYVIGVLGFMFYQNRKLVLFPSGIVRYLPANQAGEPIFFESADYFLPLHHHRVGNAHFLLSWETALSARNIPNATVDYKIIQSVREQYGVGEIVPVQAFTKDRFSHFYVVDEASRYQIEAFIASGRVKVLRRWALPIAGHQLLECSF